MMTADELLFWDRQPQLLPLYELLRERLMFAMASPPVRRRKTWPKEFMMVSFGLSYQIDSPRIAMSVEAYPNRWTHHVIVESPEDIDGTLLGWIHEAYLFSDSK